MKNQVIISLIFFSLISAVSAVQVCETYDDFSSGVLDTNKWEIRQDTEGQPLMDEYGVLEENEEFVFHTQQNTMEDRRVYLFPKRNFTTGDSIEYDINLISSEGTYAQMVLLTGDQSIRIGMRGTAAGFDELGTAHMKLVFEENNLHIERETPSHNLLIDNLTLTNTNGNYSLYIGSFSGSNGMVHMNYDNFILCSGQEESSDLEARLTALENKVDELEDRINLLDTMINRIKSYFFFSPLSVRKAILCDSLEKSNETEITEWDLTCKIQSKNSRERCVCNKLK